MHLKTRDLPIKDKLDNQEEAKYYIHLQPEDYKTGRRISNSCVNFLGHIDDIFDL